MNEAETRAERIDPKLKENGWGVIENSKVLRERNVCKITEGRIQSGGRRTKPLIADYILVYRGIKLAVVEAKASNIHVSEGVAQAKLYAEKLQLAFTYSTNGKEIYQINMLTGEEKRYPIFFLLRNFGKKHIQQKQTLSVVEVLKHGAKNFQKYLLRTKAVHGNCDTIRK